MRNQLSEELKEQLEGMQKYRSYENKVEAMEEQYRRLITQAEMLKTSCEKEQKDVSNLEKGGLLAFYLKIRKKYEETMDKEVLEAAAARAKLENKQFEARELERDIDKLRAEQRSYENCEDRYHQLYDQKLKELLAEDNSDKIAVLECRTKISNCEHNKKELQEAIYAGNRVWNEIESVEESLDSAEDWGTWDLVGGGVWSGIEKHSHLDEAKDKVNNVQYLMSNFKTELADVKMDLDIQINTDGFARFADLFFDGLFADLAMQNRINEAQESAAKAKWKVREVLVKLERQLEQEDNEIAKLQNQIDKIVNNA